MTACPKQRLVRRILAHTLGTLTGVATEYPAAALTFDDGPHPSYTPRLLDILARHGANATFFVVGQAASHQVDLIKRMAEAGHEIGNHSWDHPSFPSIPRRERWAQLRTCAAAVAPFGSRLFRPPYGDQSLASRLDAWLLGYQVVTWNIAPGDWLDEGTDELCRRLKLQLRPGSITLLHDARFTGSSPLSFDRGHTLLAVERILDAFAEQYEFVTVTDLLQHGRPQYRCWLQESRTAWLNTRQRQNGTARQYS